MGWKPVVKACVLAVGMIACLCVVYATPLGDALKDRELRGRLQESAGPWLALTYLAVGSALIGVGVPRTAYTALGGALFGAAEGALWGHTATMIGSMGCFWIVRRLGREWVSAKWGHRFDRLEERMRQRGFAIVLLVRLCPVGNNYITNCLAAVSAVRQWPFFFASLIGHAPLTIFFALVGSGVAKGEHYKTMIGLVCLIAASVALAIYYHRSPLALAIVRDMRGGTDEQGSRKP